MHIFSRRSLSQEENLFRTVLCPRLPDEFQTCLGVRDLPMEGPSSAGVRPHILPTPLDSSYSLLWYLTLLYRADGNHLSLDMDTITRSRDSSNGVHLPVSSNKGITQAILPLCHKGIAQAVLPLCRKGVLPTSSLCPFHPDYNGSNPMKIND